MKQLTASFASLLIHFAKSRGITISPGADLMRADRLSKTRKRERERRGGSRAPTTACGAGEAVSEEESGGEDAAGRMLRAEAVHIRTRTREQCRVCPTASGKTMLRHSVLF